jgi:hypothetical protein
MTNKPKTAAATAAASRNADERKAEHLRARGWTCVPPEYACTAKVTTGDGTGHHVVRMEFHSRDAAGGGCE